MNKFIYWRKKILKKITCFLIKYNCDIQFVNNLTANACVIKFEKKYIIFISNKVDKNLYPIIFFHEIGHIIFKTINTDPKKYHYISETISNIYAICQLCFIFKFHQNVKMLFWAIFSERKLYDYFKKVNMVGGDFIYENFSRD